MPTSWRARASRIGASAVAVAALSVSAGMLAGALGQAPAGAAAPGAAVNGLTKMWTVPIPDGSAQIALSSPNLDTFAAGGPAALVGDRNGSLYALHLTGGGEVAGYPKNLGAPVTSTPSVVQAGATAGTIALGTGDAAQPCVGGYVLVRPTGAVSQSAETNPPTDHDCAHNGVVASLAIGSLQRHLVAVSGSLGQYQDAFTVASASSLGGPVTGFPWFQADTSFSTPAIADLYGTGGTEVVEGGASTAGLALGGVYSNGGHIRILSGSGNYGTGAAAGGLACEVTTDQTVTSSPAVGPFLAAGAEGIVSGTGTFWPGASTTNQLIAITTDCGRAWTDTLAGATSSSPALADLLGNGSLQVVEATRTGTVYALNGANGGVLWSHGTGLEVFGSVTVADLGGGAVVIVPTVNGVVFLTGANGTQLGAVLDPTTGFQNSVLVTDDPNGSVGLTMAGYQSTGSRVWHYELANSSGAAAVGAGTWPGFHDTPALRGNAGTGPDGRLACGRPARSGGNGYFLAAADGGIFDFSTGSIPFCGSTGGLALTGNIVSITATPTGGGYWEVESTGGVYAFGNAEFHTSMGGRALNRPIVGMAEDPATGGYWLVASDGGIFAFTAPFYGSMGGTPLNAPIVGIAATPTGNGYYEVASDGGLFAFNASPTHPVANFHGSMGDKGLNRPVVGMTIDPATGGYWEVASDGGIFSFTAPFYGSTGNIALDQPIVGMTAADNGDGYWFVASDGGVFAFRLDFHGSMGNKPLNRPVVGMAGFATSHLT